VICLRSVSLAGTFLACLALFVLTLVSCSDSTRPDPGNGGPPDTTASSRVAFDPPDSSWSLNIGEEKLFKVIVNDGPALAVRIERGDSLLTTETQYLYQGLQLGADSLTATAVLSDSTFVKDWRIWIDVDLSIPPPVIGDVEVDHGPTAGSLDVSWTWPGQSATPRRIIRYLVAISHTGPIFDWNWTDAVILEAVAHHDEPLGYLRHYTYLDFPALQPGQQVWVAVRAEDVAGLFSPVGPNASVRISDLFWLQGYVRDDLGAPLAGVIVDYGCDTCKTNTDPEGWFELGPLRDVDRFVLGTATANENSAPDVFDAYYDFRTDTLDVDSVQPVEIFLISRYGVDPGCPAQPYEGDFLQYLLDITRTDEETIYRPNRNLYKWADGVFPLAVFIPPAMVTFPLDSVCREALQIWNDRVAGEDLFREVTVYEECSVVFDFQYLSGNQFGRTEILVPEGNAGINEIVPERMRVLIHLGLNTPTLVLEVMLHELGHSLCLGGHSPCANHVHLMEAFPAGIIEARWPESPINEDEVRAVRCLRNLPQGTPMGNFLFD